MALAQRHLIRAILGLCLFAFASIARAQSPAPAAVNAPVLFRVVTMSQVETLFFDAGKTRETINAGIGSFSRLYPAPKSLTVTFYKEVPNPDPKLGSLRVTLAKAQLPAGKPGPFVIILNRNPAGSELDFASLVLDASLDAFPAKTYRVFNYSKRRLAVRLADVNLVLSTAQSDFVPYPATRKAWLQVAADEKNDGWLLVSSSAQAVGANSRTTIFLVDIAASDRDPNPKGIVARRIRETIVTDDKGVQHIQ